jgi:predicted dienelactone hydrolase
MKKLLSLGWMLVITSIFSMISSCATATMPEDTPSPEPAQIAEAVEEAALPLSGPGPYPVGIRRNNIYEDDSRGGREVALTLWYPADPSAGAPGEVVVDAAPDQSGAPYPVILSSTKLGFIFAQSMASHGFSYIGVNKIDSYFQYDNNLVDQPLDIMFGLRTIAENPPTGLEGVFNTDNAGALGYSFDALNALAMSGARIDPQAYLEECANAAGHDPVPPDWWIEYMCTLAGHWDEFEAHSGPAITESEDGLWQPMTDARIKAVMPMGPEGAWLFNERGLAAVDRPIFLISAEDDEINIYELEAAVLFEQIGAAEKYMVTIKDKGHMMINEKRPVEIMKHFVNAFFGYSLQGREEYREYFSEEFVSHVDDLAWGVYQDTSKGSFTP